MYSLSRQSVFKALSLAIIAGLLFILTISGLAATAYAGPDTDPLGSGGLGNDLTKEDVDGFTSLSAADFIFTIIDRNNILVEPRSNSKVFYTANSGAQVTLGDYFPTQGVVVTDGDTDEILKYTNEQFGFNIDFFDNNSELVKGMDSIEDHLGSADTSQYLNSFEFTWSIRENDRNIGDDDFFVLDSKGWNVRQSGAGSISIFGQDVLSEKGLVASNIRTKENFNLSLQVRQIDDNIVVIESTEAGDKKQTFLRCDTPSQLVFSQNCLGAQASLITFNPVVSLDDLLNETTTLTVDFDGQQMEIYGGSNPALQLSVNNALEGAEAEGGPSCESEGGEFSFIMCPALLMLNDAFTTLDGWVIGALNVNEGYFTETSANGGIKRVWQSIRNIAYIVLIPIMLVMVIGTAVNASFIDAYTVKRALPRLFAAVVFMALSYNVALILIEMSNVVGRGTAGLVANPFGGLENLQLTNIFNPDLSDDKLALTGVLAIGILTLAGAFSFLILLSFLASAVGTLLIVFFVLTIREMLVVFLVVMGPLAILSWIFKGNDALWKLWWGTFWKLLVLFPVIMAFLVIGRGFASLVDVAENSAGQTEFFVLLIKLIAFVGPYFLIPSAFRFVGGAFANLAGSMNDKSKGLFDRNKQFRGNQRKKDYAKFKAGERGPSWNRKFGEGVGALSEAENKRKFLTNSAHRQEAMAQQRKMNEVRYGKTERSQATQEDDHMLQAQTYTSAAEARRGMGLDFGHDDATVERAIAAADATGGFSAQKQNFATRQLVRTGTGYRNQDQMQATVARVARSESEAADLLGEMNATTKGANRHDLAAGFGNQVTAQTNLRARIAAAGGVDAYRSQQVAAAGGEAAYRLRASDDRAANFLQGAEMTELHAQAAADIDGVTLVRQKPRAVGNMAAAARETFQAAEAAGNTERTAAWAGHIEKIEQAGTYASMNAAEEAGTELITPTAGIDPATGQLATRVEAGPNTDLSGNNIPIAVPTQGRAAVKNVASPSQLTVNPRTGNLEAINDVSVVINPKTGAPQYQTDVDPQTNKPVKSYNPDHDQDTSETYKRHNTSQPYDPNGPYAQ